MPWNALDVQLIVESRKLGTVQLEVGFIDRVRCLLENDSSLVARRLPLIPGCFSAIEI